MISASSHDSILRANGETHSTNDAFGSQSLPTMFVFSTYMLMMECHRILQTDNAAHATNRSSKDILMSIMSGPPGGDEEIGKQALTCIHKMMVTNWQFLDNRS